MSDFDWVAGVKAQESQLSKLAIASQQNIVDYGDATLPESSRDPPKPQITSSLSIGRGRGVLSSQLRKPGCSTVKKPDPVIELTDNAETAPTPEEASLLRKVLRDKLVHTKNEVESIRTDPKSPLYSVKSFEELHLQPKVLDGVYAMGFNTPSKIQETALPILLNTKHNNLIAQSQSGTGKTAAFVLAMLNKVDPSENYPQVICLAPTLELALQIGEVCTQMAKFIPEIKIQYAVRGDQYRVHAAIKSHIIIGTPGTVIDYMLKKHFVDESKISMFVLDEADIMISTQGHKDQSIRIHKKLPKNCQMLLFSATYDQTVMDFAIRIIPNAIIIRLRKEEESLDNIKQYYVHCENREQKCRSLSNIYGVITVGQAIIFTRTRKAAYWLSERLTKNGHAVAILAGDMDISARVAVLNRFRDGKDKVLISTNLSARGIDIEQVSLVINYDMPTNEEGAPDFETYLHRIGRTGRFGKEGIAINLIGSEQDENLLSKIEAHFKKKVIPLMTDNPDELESIQQ